MKICVGQVFTENIKEYTQYSLPINQEYCKKHGYGYFLQKDSTGNHHPSWEKVFTAKHLINQGFDIVMMVDADAIFFNQDIKIEDQLGNPDKIFIISENGMNGGMLLNLGVFIVRNTPTTLLYLDQVIQHGQVFSNMFSWPWEQESFNFNYQHDELFRNKVDVRPMRFMNSWWIDYQHPANWPDIWIMHLMANDNQERINFFSNYLNKLNSKLVESNG